MREFNRNIARITILHDVSFNKFKVPMCKSKRISRGYRMICITTRKAAYAAFPCVCMLCQIRTRFREI